MSTENKFQTAVEQIKTLKNRPDNTQLLSLYAFFKQATEGDITGEKPGLFDFKAAAKYKAWEELKGMEAEEAKEKYIALVEELIAKDA